MSAFFDAAESALIDRFMTQGWVIVPAEDRAGLERIRDHAAALAGAALGRTVADLDRIHEQVGVAGLNDLRLAVIRGLNAEPWLRPAYFRLARRAIETLVGNELAMQRRLNLSIQLPEDDSSLLPVHADVWSGDSPYEVVLWVPLVDCYRSKSMFIAPLDLDGEVQRRLAGFEGQGAEALFRAIEPELTFLEVPFGQVLLFSQNLMHGNRINREPDTRWSMNCRFKGLLAPYADKRLGEFFEPITLRPATRLGLSYRLPEGFHE